MIAGVKGSAVLSALLLLLLRDAQAADDMAGAVRELARRTAALAGRGEPVSVSWRNLSSLASGDFNQARVVFDAALREAGVLISEIAPVADARLTLSGNPSQFLLVEEVRKGDGRQVWIASWKRPPPAGAPTGSTLTLEKKLVWEQEEQILDVVILGPAVLVLSPSRVSLRAESATQSLPLIPPRPWPRDLRGHLRVNGSGFQAYLPGVACSGATAPSLTMECHRSDEPWTLDAGPRGVLLASFTPGRNHFDGRVSTANGLRKMLAPFFSAASAEEDGRPYWFLAMLDGRTQILDGAFDPVGSVTAWGSDIAGTEARCGGGSQILATKAGDAREPDAVRAFGLVDRTPVPLSVPLDLPGPVSAFWSLGGNAALAVVNDLTTGRYQAYVITVNCGV
ncbi:MAG: hypothetical protein NTW28_31225 [Candidatus Solibacter sp.]|nr:hypothetical protein [Candidatus Solibacter sp.]